MTGYLVVVNAARRAAIRFSFKGITDSFALRVQNDRSFSYCERRKARGIPFFLFRGITDSFALRAQNDTAFSHCEAA